MRNWFFNASLVFCMLAISGCSGPVGPIAGGILEGAPKPWPQDWSFTADYENVLLQTNSAEPYSVTLWGVYVDEHFYVASSDQQNRWALNLKNDPKVVLSIEGNLYSGVGIVVTDAAEAAQVLEQYSLKYDFYSDEGEANEGIIFRLTQAPE